MHGHSNIKFENNKSSCKQVFLSAFTATERSTATGEMLSQTSFKLHFLHDKLATTKPEPCEYSMTLIASVRLRDAGSL